MGGSWPATPVPPPCSLLSTLQQPFVRLAAHPTWSLCSQEPRLYHTVPETALNAAVADSAKQLTIRVVSNGSFEPSHPSEGAEHLVFQLLASPAQVLLEISAAVVSLPGTGCLYGATSDSNVCGNMVVSLGKGERLSLRLP